MFESDSGAGGKKQVACPLPCSGVKAADSLLSGVVEGAIE